jgi:hypothetical protein
MNEPSNESKKRKGSGPWLFIVKLFSIYFAFIVVTDDSYRLDENCEATGWFTESVMAVKEQRFWRNQLNHIDKEVARLRSIVPDILMAKQAGQQAVANLRVHELQEQMYRENPKLRPTPAQQYANALRERADAVEESAGLQALARQVSGKVAKAMACRHVVISHLNGGY